MLNTVILKWNPAISLYSMHRFLQDIVDQKDVGDWSVYDHEKIDTGDTFYMLKVGEGQTGIVKQGEIISSPEIGEDWSGRGRLIYYCDYEAEFMINPDTFPLLTSEQLQEAIPDFDWFGGHSGVVLNEEQAKTLYGLWAKYVWAMRDEFRYRLEMLERRSDMVNDQLYMPRHRRLYLY